MQDRKLELGTDSQNELYRAFSGNRSAIVCATIEDNRLQDGNWKEFTLQVHIAPLAKQFQGANSRALTGLIAWIGHPSFSQSLFSFVRDMIQADHLTVFCDAADGGTRTVLAENIGLRPIARAVAERYVRHHWVCDPVQRVFARRDVRAAAEREAIVVGIDAADVEHTDYRDDCYSSVNLNHRLSIANVRDGKTMRVNFYRRSGYDFSQDEVEQMMGITNLLMAMVWRHDEDRRRAYTRLSISSQNELMRRLMT